MSIIIISEEKGVGYSSNSSTIVMLAMTAMNRKLQTDSNVLRIHILHIMKGSHASTMAQLR